MAKKNEVPTRKPPTSETAKDRLKRVATETAQASGQQANKLPKGNAVEAELQGAGGATPAPEQPKKPGRPQGTTVANGAKPKGGEAQGATTTTTVTTTEVKKEPVKCADVDIITPTIAALAIPIISKRTKKKVEQIMYTKEQLETIRKVQPANNLSEPSWPAYFVTAISLMVINIYQAEKVEVPVKQMQEQMKVVSRQTTPENGANPNTNAAAPNTGANANATTNANPSA